MSIFITKYNTYILLIILRTVLGNNIFQKYGPSYLNNPDPTNSIDTETRVWPSTLAKWVSILMIKFKYISNISNI